MSNRHEFSKSTAIRSCDYDDTEGKMIIEFASGGVYHYPSCPKAHYEALKQAASPGAHFHKNLRQLKSKKVD
jgi:hypothetical protein